MIKNSVAKCIVCKKIKSFTEYSRSQAVKLKPKCKDCVSMLPYHGCQICKQPELDRALAIDHDHKTGFIRGQLCKRCNTGLGLFRDSIPILQCAIKYLKGSQSIQESRKIMERLVKQADAGTIRLREDKKWLRETR
jgi:hypothetical protein